MIKMIFSFLFMVNILHANESLNSIYEHIILKNSKEAVVVAEKLKSALEKEDTPLAKKEYTELVKAVKRVEAFYILGDLNDEYIDLPRYLDIFHQGTEDIQAQLDLIIKEKEDLSLALYKNSHKTINALEYLLFTKDLKNPRVKAMALMMIDAIHQNLTEIYEGYKEEKAHFVSNEQNANAMMLNALIESAYKLKEWRVGDPAGLSHKFRGKPDNRRAEFQISKNAMVAIEAILKTHLQVLDKQNFENFGSMIRSYQVTDELQNAITALKSALAESQKIKNDDFSQAAALYESLKKLHTTYFISLIGKLKITSKILDSDGD